MKTTLKIMKNELRMLFCSPIAWIVLVIFFFHCGSTFCDAIEPNLRWKAQGYDLETITLDIFAGWKGLFTVMLDKIFIYFPLITMGILSKEYSGGSISLLYSSPISNRKIVWGKYLALVVFSFTFIALFIVFTLYCLIIVPHLEIGMVLAGLLGFILLCCAYAAIGLFMSSLTSYQVVAAIGTFAVLALLNNVGSIGQENPIVREITHWLSINGRSDSFVRGLICTDDVVYYLVIIGLFLSLTLAKLNFERSKKGSFAKVCKYVGIVVVAVAIGYVSSRPKMMAYADLTSCKSNTLTPASQEIMKQLDGPMTITTYANIMDKRFYYASPRNFKNDTKMFTQYLRFKPDIKLKYVYYYHDCENPDNAQRFPNTPKLEDRARHLSNSYRFRFNMFLKPSEIDSLVDLSGEEYFLTRQISYNGQTSYLRMFDDMTVYPGEAEISAAMLRFIDKNPPVILFATGHGERSMYGKGDRDFYTFGRNVTMRHSFINQGFNTEEIDLTAVDSIPSSALAIIIGDPQSAYSERELAMIKAYLDQGGNAIVAAGDNSRDYVNPVIAELGLVFDEGFVVREHDQYAPELMVSDFSQYAQSISGGYAYLRANDFKVTSPRSIPIAQFDDKGYQFIPVFCSDSTGCWIEKTTTDFLEDVPVFEPEKGEIEWNNQPLMLGAVKQVGDKLQKIVVIGNADCISNGEFGMSRKGFRAANYNLALESARWFSNGQYPVNVSRQKGKDNEIRPNYDQLGLHKLVFIWLIPLLFAALGAVICLKRHKE